MRVLKEMTFVDLVQTDCSITKLCLSLEIVLIITENYIKFTLVFRQIITRYTLEQICTLTEQNMNPLIPIYKIMHLPFVMRCIIWYQSLFGVCIIV